MKMQRMSVSFALIGLLLGGPALTFAQDAF
jgi:hypothetical protein